MKTLIVAFTFVLVGTSVDLRVNSSRGETASIGYRENKGANGLSIYLGSYLLTSLNLKKGISPSPVDNVTRHFFH